MQSLGEDVCELLRGDPDQTQASILNCFLGKVPPDINAEALVS